jgi:oligopeptide/dipeptide ABC transporter ATP-binding protein
MKDLARDLGIALVVITHNLGIVARYADRVNVMYAGKIREMGRADDIYGSPRHPYTVGLLSSVPRLDQPTRTRLAPIRGEIPNMAALPAGCAFRPRCDWAVARCESEDPALIETGAGHLSACWEHARVRPGAPAAAGVAPGATGAGA